MAKEAKKKRGLAQRIRFWVQVGFFVLVAVTTTASILAEKGIKIPFIQEASLHAVCPFGGVVSFWQLASLGTLAKKVHDSSVVLAVIGILLAILAGPVICGWVCPFGTFQEWLGKLGRKIFKKRFNTFVPPAADKILRYLRYGMLVWVSYMTIISGKLFFQDIDPYFALFNFWGSEVSVAGFVILGIVIVLSLFVDRPFCKYACPYGAFLGVFNLFRIFGIKRNANTCISCSACNKACPMNIDVMKASTVRDHQCISCLKCGSEAACPVASTVELMAGKFPADAEKSTGKEGSK